MNISELLKAHEILINKVRERAETGKIEAQDLEIPLETRRQRAEEIGRQIDGLGLQKKNANDHYDTAIAKQKAELARMKDDIARTEKLVRMTATPPNDLFKQAQKAAEQGAPPSKKQEAVRQPPKGTKK
jgi:multidrug resistance efflux pump